MLLKEIKEDVQGDRFLGCPGEALFFLLTCPGEALNGSLYID